MPRPSLSPRVAWPPAVAALLAVLVSMGGATSAGAAARATHPRSPTVTVTTTPSGAPIPSGFLGISTEVHDLPVFTGPRVKAIDPVFIRLLGEISPGQRPIMRIAGDSTDASWYPVAGQRKPPGVNYTITPHWLALARAAAQGLNGKLILGVNLEANNKAIAAGEARAMLHGIGSRYIDAIEIGNEPNLYYHFPWYHTKSGAAVRGRPASYSEADYFAQFNAFAHAMPRVPIAGPVLGTAGPPKPGVFNWLDDLGGFLHANPFTALVTIHAYPLKHCSASHIVTIPEVLAPSSEQGFVASVAPVVTAAQRAHKPIRIDELNAISCGGTKGVSNSFGSALWMIDTLFGLAQTGVGGINVHMTPGHINAILNPVGNATPRAIAVQPEFYSMMMFAQAAPPGSRILRLRAALPSYEQVWATRDASGTVRVVLIDKSPSSAAPTSLAIPGVTGPATVESLRARHLDSTEGVTLGGQTFGTATHTGELSGTAQQQSIVPLGGRYSIRVAPASVEMLTLHPPAGALLMSALSGRQLLSPLLSSW